MVFLRSLSALSGIPSLDFASTLMGGKLKDGDGCAALV